MRTIFKKKIGLILQKNIIKKKYEKKQKEEENKKTNIIQINYTNTNKWVHVLPPIVPFTVKKNINDELHNENISQAINK